jgi:ABC-type phosphate transport system substrate-binding protein
MMKKYLLSLFLLFGSLLLTAQAQAQAVVIANPSVKSADVSKSDLRDVFTGAASSLKDGSHVTPVLLKSGTANDEFLSTYVGKNDSAFRAGWRSLVFSGQATMPKSLDSDTAVVEYVAHNAGAIGYISKASPHEGVKVLAVK